MRDAMVRWNHDYRSIRTPWEFGHPTGELVRMVEEGVIEPCRVFELGCESGFDAMFLARRGFDVTAADCSDVALGRARKTAPCEQAVVQFVQADLCEFDSDLKPNDFIFERSCYEFTRWSDLDGYRQTVARLTRAGSRYLLQCGNSQNRKRFGPPGVSERAIHKDWEDLFEFEWLYQLLPTANRPVRDAGRWSCLMIRRP